MYFFNYDYNKNVGLFKFLSGYWKFHIDYSRKIISAQTGLSNLLLCEAGLEYIFHEFVQLGRDVLASVGVLLKLGPHSWLGDTLLAGLEDKCLVQK